MRHLVSGDLNRGMLVIAARISSLLAVVLSQTLILKMKTVDDSRQCWQSC